MRYPPVSYQEIQEAHALRAHGFTLAEIGKAIKRAKSTVYWMLKEKRATRGDAKSS